MAPLEGKVQADWFDWAKTVVIPQHLREKYGLRPAAVLADFAYAVPNGLMLAGTPEQRAKYMNAQKRRGYKVGVSDICIALPVGQWAGAYLELKRDVKGKPTESQQDWLDLMSKVGYYCAVAPGLDSAKGHALTFLKG